MRAGQDGASRVTGGRILWLLSSLGVKKTNVLRTGDKRTCEKELCSLVHVKGVELVFSSFQKVICKKTRMLYGHTNHKKFLRETQHTPGILAKPPGIHTFQTHNVASPGPVNWSQIHTNITKPQFYPVYSVQAKETPHSSQGNGFS